ncbi:integral membrane protein [Phaeosphaeriaceae sp. PMI808]|nr:integral membrane protein [Phaeosphaeriaceae sp. PMI808]
MKANSRTILFSALLALTTRVSAQVASVCPSNNVCFKLNIPEQTVASGNGDIFFQISAPSTYEWVALGQGTGMVGSNMFLVYTSADGNNVTLSPRTTSAQVEPRHNPGAQVTLLEGSGVSNGLMTANVRCSNCNTWRGGKMDFKASSGSWVYAYAPSNGPKNSNDQSASINQHSQQAVFSWNFASAKGGSSLNPLINAIPSGTGNDGNTTNSGVTITASSSNTRNMLIAHGVLASLAFVIFFPAGAIAIRLASFPGVVWFHAAFQVFAYLVFIASFGLGVYLATQKNLLNHHHPIIGIILLVAVFFQPFLGFMHHSAFKKYNSRTLWSHAHIWLGRVAITLGMINGGLGLRLANNSNLSSKPGMIVYGVVAALMWLAWVAASVIGERKKAAAANAAPKYTDVARHGSGGSEDPAISHPEDGHVAPKRQ